MRILMYEWAAYTQGSINRILTEHHIQLDSYTHIFTDNMMTLHLNRPLQKN